MANRIDRRTFMTATAAAGSLLLPGCDAPMPAGVPPPWVAPMPPQPRRSFRLGTTLWPPDLTVEAVDRAKAFIAENCDLAAQMLLGGVPWPEAHSGAPFSDNVRAKLAYRPPPGHRLFVSLEPTDMRRRQIALHMGEQDNLPLPPPWNQLGFGAPEVQSAYANYALRVVEAMRPDYLAIGIESNLLLHNSPDAWAGYKAFHRHTYQAVKARHPDLPVCFTIEALHLLGLSDGADRVRQRTELLDLMDSNDLVAFSIYPHMSYEVPRPLPADFFEFARDLSRAGGGKPIAVAESGYPSRDVRVMGLPLSGSYADQRRYMELLLQTAERDGFEFVVNFAGIDFERLTARLNGEIRELSLIWTYTGLETGDGAAKPALEVWRSWLDATRTPV
ncbi:MAG: hypothetical protein HKM95_00635 [Inquilinus sp.]|nr:hypothetical protein [Inquilinus sp.]